METNSYRATYFDGHTAHAHEASVQLGKQHLRITLASTEQILEWDYAAIQRNAVNHDSVVLHYGNFPHQSLQVFDVDFLRHVAAVAPTAAFVQSPYSRFLSGGVGAVVAAIGGLIALGLAVYFLLLPWLIDTAVQHLPHEYEKKLGESAKVGTLSMQEVDHDKTVAVQGFLRQLKRDSKFPVTVTVVNSTVKNALAIPGGDIIVFSEVVADMKSPDELAALLGHEMGHLEHRHSVKILAKSLTNYLLISILAGDASGVMAVLLDNAQLLSRLSYNRQAEDEADQAGLLLMQQNNFKANGMVELFENLQKQRNNDDDDTKTIELPGFLQTHPKLPERIVTAKQRAYTLAPHQQPSDSAIYFWQRIKELEW